IEFFRYVEGLRRREKVSPLRPQHLLLDRQRALQRLFGLSLIPPLVRYVCQIDKRLNQCSMLGSMLLFGYVEFTLKQRLGLVISVSIRVEGRQLFEHLLERLECER